MNIFLANKFVPHYDALAISTIEAVSKPQIRFKGKAQTDRESAVRHTFWRMSIYRRPVMLFRLMNGRESRFAGQTATNIGGSLGLGPPQAD